jgi:hypothetical protein
MKVREMELREREIAVAERIASKPTTPEWIEEKARSLFRTAVILGCIVGLVIIGGLLILVMSEKHSNSSDQQIVLYGGLIVGGVLVAILKLALKPRAQGPR